MRVAHACFSGCALIRRSGGQPLHVTTCITAAAFASSPIISSVRSRCWDWCASLDIDRQWLLRRHCIHVRMWRRFAMFYHRICDYGVEQHLAAWVETDFFVPRNFIRRKKSMRISTKVSTEVSVKLSRQRFFTYQITAVDSFRRGVYTYVSMYIVTCLPTSSSKVSSMFDSYRNTCSLFGKTETAWPTLLCQLRLQE